MWKKIFDCLRAAGFDVCAPGKKEAPVAEAYVCVVCGGAQEGHGICAEQAYYDLICCVPDGRYSELEGFIRSVRTAVKPVLSVMPGIPEIRYDKQMRVWCAPVRCRAVRKI